MKELQEAESQEFVTYEVGIQLTLKGGVRVSGAQTSYTIFKGTDNEWQYSELPLAELKADSEYTSG
ncbi:hypothetical protein DID78_05985 [Candidatus Marinamargulisbacteria bacterium SCGC AG-343-D04]|nr:hypothetical protein DID78_05985 [Candidatus Marinamargulisbacteria bacterium SCGC AG-343-D04]